jgi:hypothetical protein
LTVIDNYYIARKQWEISFELVEAVVDYLVDNYDVVILADHQHKLSLSRLKESQALSRVLDFPSMIFDVRLCEKDNTTKYFLNEKIFPEADVAQPKTRRDLFSYLWIHAQTARPYSYQEFFWVAAVRMHFAQWEQSQ